MAMTYPRQTGGGGSIQRYGGPQVELRQAPVPTLNMRAQNPIAPLAQGVEAVATVLQAEKEKADKIRLDDAQNKLTILDAKYRNDVQRKMGEEALKPGEDGQDAFAGLRQQWSDDVQAIQDSLGNGAQKGAFGQMSGKFNARFETHILDHQASQQKVYEEMVARGTVDSALKAVMAAPYDDADFGDQVARAAGAVRAINRGMPEEEVKARVDLSTSKLFATRLRELITLNPAKAKELIDKNPTTLVGEERHSLTREVLSKFRGTAADAIVEKYYNAELSFEKQMNAARAEAKTLGDPDITTFVERGMDARRRTHLEDRADQVSVLTDRVDALVQGKKLKVADVYKVAESLGLPAKEATALEQYWKSISQRDQLHARQMAVLTTPEQQKKNIDAMYAWYGDPERFANAKRFEFDGLREQLPPDQWQQFLGNYTKLKNDPQALRDAVVDRNQVGVALASGGWITDANPTGETEKAMLNQAQGYIVSKLNARRARHEKITPEIRQEEIANAMAKVVTETHWYGDNTSPRFMASDLQAGGVPEEFATAFRRRFGQVPDAMILDEFRKNKNLFDRRPAPPAPPPISSIPPMERK